MAIKRREIIVLGFIFAGLAMQGFAYIGGEGGIVRGLGAVVLVFGIAIEIIGLAIYDDNENKCEK